LVKNDLVKLMYSKNKRHKFVSLSDPDNKKPVEVTGKIDFDSFRLPYCRTGHSCQGVTIRKKYCVHDAYNKVITAHWLFPALTRGVRLSDVYINKGNKEFETAEPKFKVFVQSRLTLYKDYDEERGFSEEYSLTQIVQMAKISFGKGAVAF